MTMRLCQGVGGMLIIADLLNGVEVPAILAVVDILEGVEAASPKDTRVPQDQITVAT